MFCLFNILVPPTFSSSVSSFWPQQKNIMVWSCPNFFEVLTLLIFDKFFFHLISAAFYFVVSLFSISNPCCLLKSCWWKRLIDLYSMSTSIGLVYAKWLGIVFFVCSICIFLALCPIEYKWFLNWSIWLINGTLTDTITLVSE